MVYSARRQCGGRRDCRRLLIRSARGSTVQTWFQKAFDDLKIAVSVADRRLSDEQLVYVNETFSQVTGYAAAECVGRNCRFLQCAETDPKDRMKIRESLEARRPFAGVIINRRRDGALFTNLLVQRPIMPVFDGEYVVGCQFDATILGAPQAIREKLEELKEDAPKRSTELLEVCIRGHLARAQGVFAIFESRLLHAMSELGRAELKGARQSKGARFDF